MRLKVLRWYGGGGGTRWQAVARAWYAVVRGGTRWHAVISGGTKGMRWHAVVHLKAAALVWRPRSYGGACFGGALIRWYSVAVVRRCGGCGWLWVGAGGLWVEVYRREVGK